MALPGLSKYQKQLAVRRRTGDITRLTDQYQKNVQAMTADYEKAFGQYQADVAAKMAPYEAAMAQYSAAIPEYEKQAAAYRESLNAYQDMLREFEANPYERVPAKTVRVYRNRIGALVDGQKLSFEELQQGGYAPIGIYAKTHSRGGVNLIGIESVLMPRKAPDPFSQEAPVAPKAPTAPEIADFDVAPFEARRGQLESEFKRELGERKAARKTAVSRGNARPLLQGT